MQLKHVTKCILISDIYNNKNVHLHPIPIISDIKNLLNEINPDIIVSLASFHHLIISDESGKVDQDKSIYFQKEIIDICIENSRNCKLFLIIDLFEFDLCNNTNYRGIPNDYWNTVHSSKLLRK